MKLTENKMQSQICPLLQHHGFINTARTTDVSEAGPSYGFLSGMSEPQHRRLSEENALRQISSVQAPPDVASLRDSSSAALLLLYK